MIPRAVLAAVFLLSACGALSGDQGSSALSGGEAASPTPTPGRPTGAPTSGQRRVQDELAGWSLDIPEDWHDRASFSVRGREIRSYDPRGGEGDPIFPPSGEVSVRVELQPNYDGLDLETFADRFVWTATCRPCRRVLERAELSLGGESGRFFSVWQSQPAGPFQDLEPNLYWLLRSPFFTDRVLVIRATPAASPLRGEVERMVGTLQLFRPEPPSLVPTRSKQQVIELLSEGRTITRIEAKLMLWSEWERAHNELLRATSVVSGGPSGVRSLRDPDTLVWVVAYAGSGFTPMKGGPPGPGGVASTPRPWLWGVSVVPAREPFGWGGPTTGGFDSPWPVWFDALTDRARS